MKLSRFFPLVPALLALVLAGCSGGPRPGGVTVSLVDFQRTEALPLENRGTLTLRYTNENISPLGFSGSKHKLFLNDKYIGQAVSSQPFGIPPLNTTTQDVSVVIEHPALVRQIAADSPTQTVTYRLESVLFQTMYEEKYEIKTVTEGTVDVKAIPAAAK